MRELRTLSETRAGRVAVEIEQSADFAGNEVIVKMTFTGCSDRVSEVPAKAQLSEAEQADESLRIQIRELEERCRKLTIERDIARMSVKELRELVDARQRAVDELSDNLQKVKNVRDRQFQRANGVQLRLGQVYQIVNRPDVTARLERATPNAVLARAIHDVRAALTDTPEKSEGADNT